MIKLLKNLTVYKWIVLAILGLVFIQSMADLFLPTLMADIIDKGVVVGDIPYIWKIGGLMLVVSAFSALASVVASYYSSKAAMGFGRDIRRKVFKHVESFSLQDFDKVGTASLITRTTNDITQVQQVVIMMLTNGCQCSDYVCWWTDYGDIKGCKIIAWSSLLRCQS